MHLIGGTVEGTECGRTFEWVPEMGGLASGWRAVYGCGFECVPGPGVWSEAVVEARMPGRAHPHRSPRSA